jgi:hypothetical protein
MLMLAAAAASTAAKSQITQSIVSAITGAVKKIFGGLGGGGGADGMNKRDEARLARAHVLRGWCGRGFRGRSAVHVRRASECRRVD